MKNSSNKNDDKRLERLKTKIESQDSVIKELKEESKQLKLKKQLKESESLFWQVINNSPNCIFVKDREGCYILVNQRMADMHKTTPEALIGMTDRFLAKKWLTSDTKIKEFKVSELKVFDKKQIIFIPEEEFTYRDGTKRWFQTTKLPITWKNNQDYLMAVAVDITERKKAEEKIRKLSKVVETTPEAVVITDMQGTIEYVNPGLLILGGFEDDNLIIGKSVFMFSNEEGVKQLKEEIIPTILSEGKWRGEVPVKRKDCSIFLTDMIFSLILDEEGKPKHLLSQYHDITKRTEAESELRERINELEVFYHAALGREERVIELKQEVNELLDQLGKKKKYEDYSK